MPSSVSGGFPQPRPDRGEPGAASPIGAAAPGPSVRLWPYRARNSAGTGRSTVVSPFFQGPAILERILTRNASAGGVPDPMLSLVYSEDDSGTGFNLNPLTLPSGTPIFENLRNDGDESAPTTPVGPGVLLVQHVADGLLHEWTMGYIIRLPRFTLKFSVHVNNAGADVSVFGYARIIENVPASVLANFR